MQTYGTVAKNEILGETLHVLVVLEEEVLELLELGRVSLVLCDSRELIVGLLSAEDVILEVGPEAIAVVEGDVRLAWLLQVDAVHATEIGGDHYVFLLVS